MRFMIVVKATKDTEAGVMPTDENAYGGHGGLPRGAREGRRAARRLGPAAELEGLARQI